MTPLAAPPPPVILTHAPTTSSARATLGGWSDSIDRTSNHVVRIEIDLRGPQARMVDEVKRMSGFTWEQLAHLFGVSRRSIHNWANGEPMSSGNEQRLFEIHGLVASVDTGNALRTRARLLDASRGLSLYELVRAGLVREAGELAVGGASAADPFTRLRVPSRPLPPDVREQRRDTPRLAERLDEPRGAMHRAADSKLHDIVTPADAD